jgi:hypothetical protein
MGEFPTVYRLGDVTLAFWLTDRGEFPVEVMRIDDEGIETSELTTGDLLNGAMLLRRVEAATFQEP